MDPVWTESITSPCPTVRLEPNSLLIASRYFRKQQLHLIRINAALAAVKTRCCQSKRLIFSHLKADFAAFNG